MNNEIHPIEHTIEDMEAWLRVPEICFKSDVYRFAESLTEEEIYDAFCIAARKMPEGGKAAFSYFYGVCKKKITDHLWD